MSTYLFVKITEYLSNLKTEHIMAATLIYHGLEENPGIGKTELRGIVSRAVNSVENITSNLDFERNGKLTQIMPQFDVAFDSIHNLLDVGVIKTNKENPLTPSEIQNSIDKLKGKLAKKSLKLYQDLFVILNNITVSDLTWRDPLGSQVISSDSMVVEKLSKNQKRRFMEPVNQMVPETLPPTIKVKCNKFVSKFSTNNSSSLTYRLSHTGDWLEKDDKLEVVSTKILKTIKNIWRNPAFHPDFVDSLNEGTYVNRVVVPLIHAALYDNPFGDSAFITTFERQSLASEDRRGDGRGRRPDIMFIANENNRVYELMYSECSRIICTKQKDGDDNIKLWREVNDGMHWVHNSRIVERGQFGIIGIQVAGTILRLNVLIRDDADVHRYYKLRQSEIPIRYSNDPSVLAELVYTLLIFRNLLLANMSLLCNSQLRRSSRNLNSSTVSSDME